MRRGAWCGSGGWRDPARRASDERIHAPVARVGVHGKDVREDEGVGWDEVSLGADPEGLGRLGVFGDGGDGAVKAEGFELGRDYSLARLRRRGIAWVLMMQLHSLR